MTDYNPQLNNNRIPALDGIRAIAILIVAWYHIWQQSWLRPVILLPACIPGSRYLSLEFIPRSGYLFVDLMLLLSAFCLFLPYAKAEILGKSVPDTLTFYKKRLIRILPPYLLASFVLFLYAAFTNQYSGFPEAIRDFLATITFTQTFSAQTYLNTHINGVLWTAAIEMQFYLIFPLLAKAFRKKPILTYLCMTAVSSAYLRLFALHDTDSLRITLNQLIAFMGVFANGMAFSYLYVFLKSRIEKEIVFRIAAPVLIAISVFCIIKVQNIASASSTVQIIQAQYRYILSLAFGLLIFACACSGPVIQFVLGNPVMKYLAAISFNFYIWHQWLAVHLKTFRFPYWEGTELPNMAGNVSWQNSYTLIVFAVAILLATLLTYLFEKPISRILKDSFIGKKI